MQAGSQNDRNVLVSRLGSFYIIQPFSQDLGLNRSNKFHNFNELRRILVKEI